MFVYVQLSQIDDNPFQARQEYGDVAELAADIMRQAAARPDTRGLQQIPTARLVGDDDGLLIPIAGLDKADFMDGDKLRPRWRVQLEFGHRRKRAFDYLFEKGIAEYCYMPLDLRDLDDNQMLDGVWQENRSRRDLSAVEEAELLESKLARSASQREVAEAWGIDRSTVANRLRLLKLPEALKEANRTGTLSERQCLSLATAVKLLDAAPEETKWGSAIRGYTWEAPIAPDKYIQYVIENPTTTSEQIRDVVNSQLSHVGKDLPPVIAAFDGAAAPGYDADDCIQPICKGCPLRLNNYCLDADCLLAKKGLFIAATLAAVSAELSLPISRDEAHFSAYEGYQERDRLNAYYQSGQRDGLVIGWRNGSGVRPFHHRPYFSHDDDFDGDGRAAIVIGHTTGLPAKVSAASQEDLPDGATREIWRKQTNTILNQVRKRAKAAMLQALDMAVADQAPLIALVQSPEAETTDDASELTAALLEFLWKRGSWMTYAPATAAGEIEAMARMLARAGISRAVLADPDRATDLSQRAVLWLSYWYHYHIRHYAEEEHAIGKAAIDALRTEFDKFGISGDLVELSFELDRAARDIAAKMAR